MAGFTGGDGPEGVALVERPASGIDDRVRAAALRCVARSGLRKTTLDDVAGEAGCSRATIYRAFPGGKDVLMASAAAAEVDRVLEVLGRELDIQPTVADTLVAAMTGATCSVLGHAALQYLWVNEPGVVQPHLSFDGIDPVLARAVDFLAPYLARFADAVTARRTAEWAARLVVLYADATSFDLTDPADARHLVETHILPGLPAASH
jgi:AcrR family transcriptional regulator